MGDEKIAVPKGLELLGYGSSFKTGIGDMIERLPAFSDMGRADVEILAEVINAYRAPARTVIFEEGKRDPFLCFVVEGRLDILKEAGEDNQQRHLTSVREGKALGEMSIIDSQPHSATVISTTPVVLLMLTRLGLERLGEQHPRVAYRVMTKIAELLSHRLRQTTGQLIERL